MRIRKLKFKNPEIQKLVDKIGAYRMKKFLDWAHNRKIKITILKSFSASWIDKKLRVSDPGDIIKELLERYLEISDGLNEISPLHIK